MNKNSGKRSMDPKALIGVGWGTAVAIGIGGVGVLTGLAIHDLGLGMLFGAAIMLVIGSAFTVAGVRLRRRQADDA